MAFRKCVQEIKGAFKSRMQPVTEWAPEFFLSFHLTWKTPNRSAGGGGFKQIHSPAYFESLSTGFDTAAAQFHPQLMTPTQ